MRDDPELLARISERDPEAFRELMERYASGIINLAYRFLGTVAEAEEAAQEVFFRLYQHPPRLNPDTKLFTWAYRVTVNLCLDILRKRSRQPPSVSLESTPLGQSLPQGGRGWERGEDGQTLREILPDSSALSPREQAARAELVEGTRRAVAMLPVSLRAPLVLSTLEQLSHQEIARILRVSPKAVERRIARAREILKARLQPYL